MRSKRIYRAGAAWLLALLLFLAILLLRPDCPFYRLTGRQCAACGGTRMLENLLHGQWAAAFAQNPYLFCALPLWACLAVWETARYLREKPPVSASIWGKPFWAVSIICGLVFFVWRNVW